MRLLLETTRRRTGSCTPTVSLTPALNASSLQSALMQTVSSLPKDSKTFPSAAQLKGVNRFILCFWVTENGGAFDNLLVWKEYPREKRRKILDEYHAAGIALMMAYGGDTGEPMGTTRTGHSADRVSQRPP